VGASTTPRQIALPGIEFSFHSPRRKKLLVQLEQGFFVGQFHGSLLISSVPIYNPYR
jgi:hypothetical protein